MTELALSGNKFSNLICFTNADCGKERFALSEHPLWWWEVRSVSFALCVSCPRWPHLHPLCIEITGQRDSISELPSENHDLKSIPGAAGSAWFNFTDAEANKYQTREKEYSVNTRDPTGLEASVGHDEVSTDFRCELVEITVRISCIQFNCGHILFSVNCEVFTSFCKKVIHAV